MAVKPEHRAEMELPYPGFKKRYKLADRRNLEFLINRFSQIGWTDPFADETPEAENQASAEAADNAEADPSSTGVRLPEDAEGLVYPEQRYIHGDSPAVIYIPSKEVMFKMMRACIGITDPKDLWIHH